jgi:hypothetical protein
VDALPSTVADLSAREVEPGDAVGAAWGDPAIVLVCGVPRPPGFGRTATCLSVNDLDWFVPEDQLESREPTDLTMTTVGRSPRVQVTLPAEHWPPATTLADLSEAVRKHTTRTGRC